MKKHLSKIIAAVVVLLVLTGTFFWGGNAPEETPLKKSTAPPVETVTPSPEPTPAPKEKKQEPVQTETIAPQQPIEEPEKVTTVSLTVDCTDVLNNMDVLKEEKQAIIPQNGIIFADSKVEITEGESVFDVLKRTLLSKGVHLEFNLTPVYNSAYIEGIGNLYEFDCGERSGWKYSVNGKYSPVGCSDYKVKPGDKIIFIYKIAGY